MSRDAMKQDSQNTSADLLSLLDERMRRIAEEVVRERERAAETGAVRVTTAMKLLDMSEGRVRALIREGKLKVTHPTPNTIRIPLSEIRRYTEGES